MMNSIKLWIGLILGIVVITSCSYNRGPGTDNYDPNHPGFRYTPAYAMYISVPYEGYSQVKGEKSPYNANGMNMKKPPEGTVPRGKKAYEYPFADDPEGYEMAGDSLDNPLPATQKNIAQGKKHYRTYCQQCHGEKGKSGGPVMASGKFPEPHFGEFSSDYIDSLPEGKMYHSITYGRNLMGSHASQVDPKERWQIIHYINEVLNNIEE